MVKTERAVSVRKTTLQRRKQKYLTISRQTVAYGRDDPVSDRSGVESVEVGGQRHRVVVSVAGNRSKVVVRNLTPDADLQNIYHRHHYRRDRRRCLTIGHSQD